jgi:hypothetical protein
VRGGQARDRLGDTLVALVGPAVQKVLVPTPPAADGDEDYEERGR